MTNPAPTAPGGMVPTPAAMPKHAPQMGRETYQAYARASSRTELMDAMRAQAEAYFGGPVTSATPPPSPDPRAVHPRYQGASRWTARA